MIQTLSQRFVDEGHGMHFWKRLIGVLHKDSRWGNFEREGIVGPGSSPHWLCRAGDDLMGCSDVLGSMLLESVVEQACRFAEAVELRSSATCSYPMPPLGEDATESPLARRVGNLDWFGHPILWLYGEVLRPQPSALAPNDVGPTERPFEIELRLAMQLELSGLYVPATGSRVDVAETHGINVKKRRDRTRIRAWQAGDADTLFDGVNIGSELMEQFPPSMLAGYVPSMIASMLELACFDAASMIVELGSERTQRQSLASLVDRFFTLAVLGAKYCSTCDNALVENVDWWYDAVLRASAAGSTIPRDAALAVIEEMTVRASALVDLGGRIVDEARARIEATRGNVDHFRREVENIRNLPAVKC